MEITQVTAIFKYLTFVRDQEIYMSHSNVTVP